LFNKHVTDIGSVNGEPINREEFAQQVEFYRNNSRGNISQMQQVNSAWNSLVREKIYKTQLEKSGIVVGEQDVWNAIVNQIKAQNNPMFQNELGMFDEEKLKEYIANLKESANDSEQAKAAWVGWVNYEKSIKSNLEQNTYNSLITSGLNSTLKDGERKYFYDNNNVDMKYIYVPFSSISDSLVKVTDDEIKSYIKEHPKTFESPASRDIEFVSFNIKPSKEDEISIKDGLASIIKDKEEYSAAAKNTVKVTGFANATDMKDFFVSNDSDIPFDNAYYTKSALPKILADSLFDKNPGEVFGPYKDRNYYKLSKVTAIKQLPDSVKASHILISYAGSAVRDPSIKYTQEEAKKIADSILKVIKADKSKFDTIAKEMSADKMSGAKGGDLGWFTYKAMVPEFRNFVFENKTNDVDIVKTQFGYHIINIDGQKNKQKNVQIATFSRKIEPSEKTENEIFQEAETFASDVSSGENFEELAKEKKYAVVPVIGLKELDENISMLGAQRQIVRWAFEKNSNENDVKRFDTDNGYAIVKLIKKHDKGLADRNGIVRTILMNKKKTELIAKRSSGESLEEIAKQNNTTVKTAIAVSNASPVLPGEGRFPEIIGVVTALDENKLAKNIKGKKGIAFAIVTKKNTATALGNYQSNKVSQERQLKNKNIQIYNAIKDNSEIEDNRATFY
jgi:peptidylprolyl isomerase/peptidyl-prolyl cis-trans isomerase D